MRKDAGQDLLGHVEFNHMPARYWSRRLRSVLIWAPCDHSFSKGACPE